jgi:hypothetical protein
MRQNARPARQFQRGGDEMNETRKVIEEHIGKLELRGTQVWICYESVPWGLKWRPVIELEPLIRMLREGLSDTERKP